jgi:hypothetical protein
MKMSKPAKASAFLSAMNLDPVAPVEAPPAAPSPSTAPPAKAGTRAGLKHIGGYFDRETVEKVAVLRARLDLDNSALLKLAIDELHRKHSAKRAFGDA